MVKLVHSCRHPEPFWSMLPYAYHLTTHPFLFLSGYYVLLISSEIVRKLLLIEIHFFCEFALKSRWWNFTHSDGGSTTQVAPGRDCVQMSSGSGHGVSCGHKGAHTGNLDCASLCLGIIMASFRSQDIETQIRSVICCS